MPNENSANESLQPEENAATMTATGDGNGNAAGTGVPEDTANAYQATISQQGDTIDALLQANERLQEQIKRMIRNGAAIRDDAAGADEQSGASLDTSGIVPPKQLTPDEIMKQPDYEPLSALGKNIGKKPTRE